MRILSVDPGYERVGIAVLEKEKSGETLAYSDCFKTPAHEPFPERLRLIGAEVERVVETHKPDCLAIETLLFNKNQKTAMHVAEARGAIIYTAQKCGLTVYEYSPLQIKVAVAGNGHAPKDQVGRMVSALVKLPDKKMIDDEIDAIATGLTHAASVKSTIDD